MNTKEFIHEAKRIHGDTYDYSKVTYTNSSTKVIIICKKHGNFSQRASSHLKGYGCKKCALEYTAQLKHARRVEKICPVCKGKFSFPESEERKGRKYCSVECSIIGKTTLKNKNCQNCNKSFKPKSKKSKYCSQSCASGQLVKKITTDIIKTRFIEKHGERFDYSEVRYTGIRKKIEIKCRKHGDFNLTPYQHLHGSICKKCEIEQKLLSKKVKRAIKLKELSKEEKQTLKEISHLKGNVKTCKECSELFVFRGSRKNQKFCSKNCGTRFTGRMKTESALPEIHDIKNEVAKLYSGKIEVKKIELSKHSHLHKANCICKLHGEFSIGLKNLLKGKDCHFCTGRKMNKSSFLEIALNKEKIRLKGYDYSKVNNFEDPANEYVTIICKKHGDFKQTPARHLRGDGCRACSIEKRGELNFKRAESKWIAEAIEKHGYLYDYSKSVYLGAQEPTEIICKIHGSFFQQPNNHLSGSGCSYCGDEIRNLGDTIYELEKRDAKLPGKLYVIECFDDNTEHFFKIGITSKTVEERFSNETTMPYYYNILLELELGLISAFKVEQRVLNEQSSYSYKPKNDFGGVTECFFHNPIELDFELSHYFEVYSLQTL